MDTEVIMNYGNILAFIQIAVAFNLGLFYLKKDDRYSTYFQQFIDMLSSSVKETMNKETERKNKNEESISNLQQELQDEELKMEKINRLRIKNAKAEAAYKKLSFLIDKKSFMFPYLPCFGLFSGIYSLTLLLNVGLFDTCIDTYCNLKELIIVWAEMVILLQLVIYLRINREKNETTININITIASLLYVILLFITGILVVIGCLPIHIDLYINYDIIILACTLTAYIPGIALAYIILSRTVNILYCYHRYKHYL